MREQREGFEGGRGFGGGPMGHGMRMPGEKPKDFKGTLKRLLVYLKPRVFNYSPCSLWQF